MHNSQKCVFKQTESDYLRIEGILEVWVVSEANVGVSVRRHVVSGRWRCKGHLRRRRHADCRRRGSHSSDHRRRRRVIVVELVESTRERRNDEKEDEKEFANVDEHAAKRDLQRTELRVRLKEENNSREAEHVGDSEDALGDDRWVVLWPARPWHRVWSVVVGVKRMEEGDKTQWERAQIQRQHDEVKPVPPLPDVSFQTFLPQLLALRPYESWHTNDKYGGYWWTTQIYQMGQKNCKVTREK